MSTNARSDRDVTFAVSFTMVDCTEEQALKAGKGLVRLMLVKGYDLTSAQLGSDDKLLGFWDDKRIASLKSAG